MGDKKCNKKYEYKIEGYAGLNHTMIRIKYQMNVKRVTNRLAIMWDIRNVNWYALWKETKSKWKKNKRNGQKQGITKM